MDLIVLSWNFPGPLKINLNLRIFTKNENNGNLRNNIQKINILTSLILN